jgi:hypothetical protein
MLHWNDLKAVALWVIEGPRSLVSSPEPTGGKAGWADRFIHWQRFSINAGLVESSTIYKRSIEWMTLPQFIVRVANWNKGGDQSATKNGPVDVISATVHHFELDPSAVTSILSREGELQLCLAAVQALNARRDSSLPPRESNALFRWTFPGFIDLPLSWPSVEETEQLDELWRQTCPRTDGLPVVNGLFERFETDAFGTYVDVSPEQIPNIHRLV